MTAQQQNAELLELLSVYFVENDNPSYALGQAVSSILALPALRAFWPMSSIDYTVASRARDIAGGGYHLTDNNAVLFGHDQLAPYAELDGVNQYLSRADGGAANWADITGTEAYVVAAQRGLTLGGWFYFDNVAGGSEVTISKDAAAPNRGYFMRRNGAGTARFAITVDGAALTVIDSTVTIGAAAWAFMIGRFVPSTSIDVYINNVKASNIAGIPASQFDNAAFFAIGARSTPGSYIDGRASLCWLCAAALSDSEISALYHNTRKLYNV